MSNKVISVEHLTKQYDLGVIGTGTLSRDLNRWWARVRHQPDPYTRIGQQDAFARIGESILALDDVSFTVNQGEALGIIGRNGAGKSTLLKILSRVTAPTSGVVKIRGRVGSLLEVGTGFHPELTGRENVYLNGAILGMKKAEVTRKFDEIVAFAGVEKFIDTPVKRYSSGMYVRLAFAVAAHLDPEILIVDEVLAVGDAEFQKKCLGKMGDVAGEGRTVLFVSHNMAAVENLCQRSIMLQAGKIEADGGSVSVVQEYLDLARKTINNNIDLLTLTERSGSGLVKLTDFHVEDQYGNRVEIVRSGMPVDFVFTYINNSTTENKLDEVDFGFSIHKSTDNQVLAVLYASYQANEFSLDTRVGKVRCHVNALPLSVGSYGLGARVTVKGIESDWPRGLIGNLHVEASDFFQSGRIGFGSSAPLLIKGHWQLDREPEVDRKK